jgi:hypothetical protein
MTNNQLEKVNNSLFLQAQYPLYSHWLSSANYCVEQLTNPSYVLLPKPNQSTTLKTPWSFERPCKEYLSSMNKDNRQLLTNEPFEYEKYPLQLQDFNMITIILEESKECTSSY